MRATVLLLSATLLVGALLALPPAPAHGCVTGLAGPPCTAPFCPDRGAPHFHPAPSGLRNSICLWSVSPLP